MNLIIVVATSKNGYITNGNNPSPATWTSPEDKAFYKKIKSEHKLFVMGRKTFNLKLRKFRDNLFRVILTRHPETFRDHSVKDKVQFENLSPKEFVDKYQKSYESCLILGGSHIYTEFLESGLVDEAYITMEPVVFTNGVSFLQNNSKIEDYFKEPATVTQLNQTGTMLYHYSKTSNTSDV